jgi:hypothetical protein
VLALMLGLVSALALELELVSALVLVLASGLVLGLIRECRVLRSPLERQHPGYPVARKERCRGRPEKNHLSPYFLRLQQGPCR